MRAIVTGAAAVLALTLAGCQGGAGGAGMAAAGMAASLDPTGIAGMAVGAASTAQAQAAPPPTPQFAPMPDYLDLGRVHPRLADVAAGNTARPGLSNPADGQLAAMQGMMAAGLAQNVAAGAMSGGVGLAMAAPTAAMQAAGLAQMTANRASINAFFGNLNAEMAAKRIVPDADRPLEAQAIMTLLDQPKGRSATWTNPATGSSGKVTIAAPRSGGEGVTCRPIRQEITTGGETRRREIAVCNQRGVWFDMS